MKGPPRLLRRVLEAVLPADVRDGIVGDLDEVYAARRRTRSALPTTLWYAGQVASIVLRFGVEGIRDALASRGLAPGLDVKLGLRMLVKYPMLTLVGGLAITVATAIGVGGSEFIRDMVAPTLPLDEGDRIVRLYHDDDRGGGRASATLYDFVTWRGSVSSLEELGAYTTLEEGFGTEDGAVGTVGVARVTPSVFQLTRVPPRLGRVLVEADEAEGAPAVVVLGHDAWQALLGGDPDAVGRTVRLGGTPRTVVGIMPEGYGFPESENAWVPLTVEAADQEPGTARRAGLVARLGDGATLESAQAELTVAGRRASADAPEVYEHLTPRVAPFARRASEGAATLLLSGVRLVFILLLVVACANVATLVFARTVTREGEIAIRTSLGASRRRIVLQLFAEALVLVGSATALGLLIAHLFLGRFSRLFFEIQQEPRPPFWWNDALSGTTVGYALILALVGAVMIGVVPGLKATSGTVRPRLGRLTAGGGGDLHFGGMWTVVIVLQVALSVAFLPVAVSQAGTAFQDPDDSGFPAGEYVTAQLGRDPGTPPRTPEEVEAFLASSAQLFEEVRARVAADPGVAGVALASGLSAMNHLQAPVECLGGDAPVTVLARVLLVDPGYLELMEATPVAGASLGSAEFREGSRGVVVNEAFADRVQGTCGPVGGRIRIPERKAGSESSLVRVPEAGAVLEVVGVVRDPGIDAYGPGTHPVVYAPLHLAPVTPRSVGLVGMPEAPATQLFVRRRPDGDLPAARLYALVGAVDPSLRLSEVGTAADAWRSSHVGARIGGWIFLGVAGIVLVLSVAGIYALMSFTVSRRTREIAIRTAMGARKGQIVRRIFGRAAIQLGIGVVLGGLIAVPVLWDGVADDGPRSLVIVAVLLLGAGLASCVIPVRRAMGIEPAVAMKSE